MKLRIGMFIAAASLLLVSSGRAQTQCVGDCNGDVRVTVNELIIGVNIALGSQPLSNCDVFDVNGDGMVAVNELILAVNNALAGCPVVAECGDGVVEGTEQCDDSNTDDGDGCSSTCQCEEGSELDECQGGGTGACELSAESGAVIQTILFALPPLPFSGRVTFTAGNRGSDGTIPLTIKEGDLDLRPVPVPGFFCACVTGVPNPDFGDGNVASGRVGCGSGGLPDVDYLVSVDHNTNDVDPNCTMGTRDQATGHGGVCNGKTMTAPVGAGPQGSVVLDVSVGFALISDRGTCAEGDGSADKGPDGIPCTADDRTNPLVARGVLTSGTMNARVIDANNSIGRIMDSEHQCTAARCIGTATGAPVDCSELPQNPDAALSGSAVALALPALDIPMAGDILITARFVCE